MSDTRSPQWPVTTDELSGNPHPLLHRLRAEEPVAWLPSLGGWLVSRHDLCMEVMLDPDTYTVDDPRFSTQQVIGPSMLSLDGAQHRRHRDPFGGPFRAGRIRELEGYTTDRARELVRRVVSDAGGDLRARVAGPLAVAVMARVLDLADVAPEEVLGWYREIVAAVHEVTAGGEVDTAARIAFEELKAAVVRNRASSGLLSTVAAGGALTTDEIVSNVAVLLFGGIVTAESSTAIAFRYLLDDAGLAAEVEGDRSLVSHFVEEAFRIEPSAAAVDRYATRDSALGGVAIARGDLVRVSLSAANRDPEVFVEPDRFDMHRENLGKSLTFARGPHACLGLHLARLEAVAAVGALVDELTGLQPGDLDPIAGLVFRTPETVEAKWHGDLDFAN
ncbi:MAG: cytochrome P450 [Acidimicrobiia bacterium]